MNENLFDTIFRFSCFSRPLNFLSVPDLDVDEVVRLLGTRIVQTKGKAYAIAEHRDDLTDCSDRTEFFDWHSDGLYHSQPPRRVLLYCLDPGHGGVKTEVADTDCVLSALPEEDYHVLTKLRCNYVSHEGVHSHPMVADGALMLASRGYPTPSPSLPLEATPSIREITKALSSLYQTLDHYAIRQEWHQGDVLIFDQHRYLHRRTGGPVDHRRKLIRMWFN